jgi:hypothetical protein
MGLQASALYAAAEGAVAAYAHITGDEWKPYESAQPTATVEQKSTAAMMCVLRCREGHRALQRYGPRQGGVGNCWKPLRSVPLAGIWSASKMSVLPPRISQRTMRS